MKVLNSSKVSKGNYTMNLKEVRSLYKSPEIKLKSAEIKEPRIYPTPKQCSIDLIFGEIKINKEVSRKIIMKKTGVSMVYLMGTLNFLLANKMVTKKVIGNAGANKVYSYSAVKGVE